MATFDITSPSGEKYKITAPDNATDAEVMQYAQANFAKQKPVNKDEKRGRALPSPAPIAQDSNSPVEGNTFLQNAAIGLGKSVNDLVLRAAQVVDPLAQKLAGSRLDQIGQRLGLPSAKTTGSNIQSNIDEAKRLDKPIMETGGGVIGNAAGLTLESLAGGKALGMIPGVSASSRLLANIPRVGSTLAAASGGAALGAALPVATGDSAAQNMAAGAIGATFGQGIAKGVGMAAKGGANAISDPVKVLAKRAKDLGINLRVDQVLRSKALDAANSGLQYLPFSGSAKAADRQVAQFNTALSKTMGENTHNMAEALKNADTRLSGEFDRVLSNNAVRVDSALMNDLARIQQEAVNEMTPDQFGIIQRQAQNLLNKVDASGNIEGGAAYNIKKQLDRMAKSSDSSLAYHARELRGALMDALNRSLGSNEAKAFAKTRQQYANMMTLDKIAPNGAESSISPARVANIRNIRTQDMQELADIAAQFLRQRIGDSGTAPRIAAMQTLVGGSAVLNPKVMAGIAAGRGLNTALNSPAMVKYTLNGSPLLGKIPQEAIRKAGQIGSLEMLMQSPYIQQQ